MKKCYWLFLLCFWSCVVSAQDAKLMSVLLEEGIGCHEKGDYACALARYDKMLEIDSNNKSALSEKAYTLLAAQRYEEAVGYCRKLISRYKGDDILLGVFVTYGNALDGLQDTKGALAAYDEGIRQFPAYYQLYYNKGVACYNAHRYGEAISCLQQSVLLDPNHAASHYVLSAALRLDQQPVPSILVRCRFLQLAHGGPRALSSLQLLGQQINMLDRFIDSLAVRTEVPAFEQPEVFRQIEASLAKQAPKGDSVIFTPELLRRKLELIISGLKKTGSNTQKNFYLDYYGAYLTALEAQGYSKVFCYLLFQPARDRHVQSWLFEHRKEVSRFYAWSDSFTWLSAY